MTRTNARELAIQLGFAAAATGEDPAAILDRFFEEEHYASLAAEDALFLSEYCNKVYIIHSGSKLGGDPTVLEKLGQRDNVEVILGSAVTKLIGEDKLSAVEVTDKSTGEAREIALAGLFVAIGQMPDNGAFANAIERDEKGYAAANESCRTRTAGVYVAGDCRAKEVRQLTTAAADGAVAALAACSEM